MAQLEDLKDKNLNQRVSQAIKYDIKSYYFLYDSIKEIFTTNLEKELKEGFKKIDQEFLQVEKDEVDENYRLKEEIRKLKNYLKMKDEQNLNISLELEEI